MRKERYGRVQQEAQLTHCYLYRAYGLMCVYIASRVSQEITLDIYVKMKYNQEDV